MTAVEKFHFGVEKCFIHTFQLAHVQERHEMQEVQKKKSLYWMKLLQGLSPIFMSFVAFLFLFVCLF